jgi:TRAP-type C4-dicarboxylate transport system permease large subunit
LGDLSHVGDLIVPGILFALGLAIFAWVLTRIGVISRQNPPLPPAAFVGAIRESRSALAAVTIVVGMLILVVLAAVVLAAVALPRAH